MRALGLLTRPLIRHIFTSYNTKAFNKICVPKIHVTMSSTTGIPQTRPLSDTELEGPALKKQRLENDIVADMKEPAVEACAKDDMEAVVSLEPAKQQQGKGVKHKKKDKKRKEPPLPEPCSAADVLYHEIRSLLGEDVVNEVTKAGKAFHSPFQYGDEVEVKIESIGSGGMSMGFQES